MSALEGDGPQWRRGRSVGAASKRWLLLQGCRTARFEPGFGNWMISTRHRRPNNAGLAAAVNAASPSSRSSSKPCRSWSMPAARRPHVATPMDV